MSFDSLLIANRGEIAVRIIRAAKLLGIRTIAVFSDADKDGPWVQLADDSHRLGPAAPQQSYLDIERLIEVARASGAGAVHPGYGFLSENPQFAAAVAAAGLVFVGPSPEAIAAMGDKVAARNLARLAGLPLLPGSDVPVCDDSEAQEAAAAIGWPVAVKASFGGGGRGMRIARGPDQLSAAIEQAQREAGAAFGRNEVFLEKYLEKPRHVEVQVLGDQHGSLVQLGDRDCTIQRRHQKLIEEAPAPGLDESIRVAMADAAIRLCRQSGYVGAGTVEFLVDSESGDFFFLEMNTRLQVEHGVTELVTGIDLVEQQIRIARGERLAIDPIAIRGHAIQARIAAEDPWENFRPVAGPIGALRLPLGPWLRCDFGVEANGRIEKYYDSMFGKIQAWGPDRDSARNRLRAALGEFAVEGVPTTAPYLKLLLGKEEFANIRHDTGIVERSWQPERFDRPDDPVPPAAAASPYAERQVAVPWGGRLVDVSVFGTAAAAEQEMGSGGRRTRSRPGPSASSRPELNAPMDSMVAAIAAQPGQRIARGEPVLILEAMKMEVPLTAPYDCIVEALHVTVGANVRTGTTLAILQRHDED